MYSFVSGIFSCLWESFIFFVCSCRLFILIAVYYFIVRISCTLYIQSTIDGRLRSTLFRAFMKCVSYEYCSALCIFLGWTYGCIFWVYTWEKLLSHSVCNYSARYSWTVFKSGCTTSSPCELYLLCVLTSLTNFIFLSFHFSYSDGCVTISMHSIVKMTSQLLLSYISMCLCFCLVDTQIFNPPFLTLHLNSYLTFICK